MIIIGSTNLKIRGLISRKPHDLDVCYNEKLIPIKKYVKKYNISLDIAYNKEHKDYWEYHKYKNRDIKLQTLYIVLFYSYKSHKHHKNIRLTKKTKYTPTRQNERDLINVFHNLGREKSLEEIDKMKNNTPINEDDVKELLNLMEIGISNETEI